VSTTDIPEKIGRYEIVGVIGKGAMGVVYEGRDPNINRRVAIKTARKDVLESSGMAEEMLVRFLREAQAAGALNHPNIITIYDAGEEGDMAYIAMEYIEGHDLRHEIVHRAALDISDIVDIGAAVAEALAEAHDHGVIHRDVKPANIMIPDNGPIKVADFGIAHVADSNLTQDGALIGTPHYMSPEQFMGHKLDGRSDLFSLGIILYELLTGEKPFAGEALSTVMHHVIKSEPASPDELNFAVPDPVAKVVLKTLSKKANDRYVDGRALAAALRESIEESPNTAILGFGAQGSTDPASDDPTVLSSSDDDPTVLSSDAGAEMHEAPAPTGDTGLDATTPSELRPDQAEATPEPHEVPRTGLPKSVLFAAPLVIVVLALAAFSVMRGGGGESAQPTDAGPSAITVETVPVRVSVYWTDDPLEAVSFRGNQYSPDEREQVALGLQKGKKAWPLENGTVRVRVGDDYEDEEPLDKETGSAMLEVPTDADQAEFSFTGTTPDEKPAGSAFERTGDDIMRAQVFVVPGAPASR
jgi:serine/threonine-protein kinase